MPNEIEEIERPALIQVGDNDERMPPIQVKAAQEIFKGRENCEIKVFPGAKHVRSIIAG